MNVKDLVVTVMLALGITVVFQYFFFSNKEQQNTVERVRVAPKTDVHRPLYMEVDFWDNDKEVPEVVTKVDTDFAKLEFSNAGAALVKADFKHSGNGRSEMIPGIRAGGKENRSFLLAFDQKTPYYFDFVGRDDANETTKLEYTANFDGGNLTKIFTIYKHKPQMDLSLKFNPKNDLAKPYRLRLIYAVPSILYAADKEELKNLEIRDDALFGVQDSKGSVVKKPVASLLDRYWETPIVFGGFDKYLVNTLIKDKSQFTQRGYYGTCGDNFLKAYLEGPDVDSDSEWNMSFYLGPKQLSAFGLVDSGLDQILDYGMLAPLSKILLRVLNFFYGYVFNFGWAIILLTLLIKILTLPLTLRGEQNTKNMATMQRKMEHIQQKYRNDPEALANARAEIVKKYGPSMGGCLIPMLVQLPVFIALRGILTTSFELYMSPFLWINNLVAPDPYYIFPLLIGLTMFAQTSANSADARKKLSSFAFAIMLGAIFSGFSAGITLYFCVSNLLNLLQTTLYRKFKKA